MDFRVGDESPLIPSMEAHATALTALESAAQEIHKNLNNILDYQTHHRLVNTDVILPSSYFSIIGFIYLNKLSTI